MWQVTGFIKTSLPHDLVLRLRLGSLPGPHVVGGWTLSRDCRLTDSGHLWVFTATKGRGQRQAECLGPRLPTGTSVERHLTKVGAWLALSDVESRSLASGNDVGC